MMHHGGVLPGMPDSVLDDAIGTYRHRGEMDRLEGLRRNDGRQSEEQRQPITPVDVESQNELRPATFDSIVGQERVKTLLRRMVTVATSQGRPLDHVLLVGASGTGKTTFAHAIARELGKRVFQLEAPISHDTLMELREVMEDGDVLFLDEIHQQAVLERRGRQSSTQPEVLFAVMEDRTLPTTSGVLPFPAITLIGATTDEGMLPDAFVNRFPIRPHLEPYTEAQMVTLAKDNASALGIALSAEAAELFAGACRGVPRELNNYVRNAAMLTQGRVKRELALEVLRDLNNVTLDGLTLDMQNMLVFLFTRAQHARGDGRITYSASVNTIATALGKSRDAKAIALRVEPYLILNGYVQVGHGGRILTDRGVNRAIQLLKERGEL